ncbi:hypothetical protein [Tumebacillus lipolyticus]|uniref:Uncharacterized protein n=1 Tax=Tumebacillus lipolyticus TaxID=1280370 RepID=A0ABW5A222_9BACL
MRRKGSLFYLFFVLILFNLIFSQLGMNWGMRLLFSTLLLALLSSVVSLRVRKRRAKAQDSLS